LARISHCSRVGRVSRGSSISLLAALQRPPRSGEKGAWGKGGSELTASANSRPCFLARSRLPRGYGWRPAPQTRWPLARCAWMILFKILLRIAAQSRPDLPTIGRPTLCNGRHNWREMAGGWPRGSETTRKGRSSSTGPPLVRRLAAEGSLILSPTKVEGRDLSARRGNFFELVNQLARVTVDVGLIRAECPYPKIWAPRRSRQGPVWVCETSQRNAIWIMRACHGGGGRLLHERPGDDALSRVIKTAGPSLSLPMARALAKYVGWRWLARYASIVAHERTGEIRVTFNPSHTHLTDRHQFGTPSWSERANAQQDK